jgi:hypothetical protein
MHAASTLAIFADWKLMTRGLSRFDGDEGALPQFAGEFDEHLLDQTGGLRRSQTLRMRITEGWLLPDTANIVWKSASSVTIVAFFSAANAKISSSAAFHIPISPTCTHS